MKKMKRQTAFLNGIHVRRLLLLVAMTMLWQVGWAATNETITDENGFKANVTLNGGVWTATITGLPNVETVRIPSTIKYQGNDIAVTALTFNACGSNTRHIYFGSLLPTGSFMAMKVTAHVPDAQFETVLSSGKMNVKVVVSDSHRALRNLSLPLLS